MASLKQRLQELQGHLSGDKTRQKLKTKEKWVFSPWSDFLTLFCTHSLRKHVTRVGQWSWLCSAGAHKSRSSKAPRSSSPCRTPLSPKRSTQYPDPAEHALPRASLGTAQRHPLPPWRLDAELPGSRFLPSSRCSSPLWLHHLQTKQMPCDSCHLPLLSPSQFGGLLAQEFNPGRFFCPSLEILAAMTQTRTRCHGCCFNKSLFIASDLNEGGGLERESFELLSRPTVGQILAPDDRWRHRGPGLPGIWRTRPALRPHPMPALLAAGGSGLRLLGRSQSCIFGECFTLGNRPGILKERPPPSPAKVSFSCFRKEVPRKERQQGGSLFQPPEPRRHSPAAAPRGTVRGPDGWLGLLSPRLGEAKAGVGDGPMGSLITVIRKSLWGLPYETQGNCEGSVWAAGRGCYATKRGLLHLGTKRGGPRDPRSCRALTHNQAFVCGLPKALLKLSRPVCFSYCGAFL